VQIRYIFFFVEKTHSFADCYNLIYQDCSFPPFHSELVRRHYNILYSSSSFLDFSRFLFIFILSPTQDGLLFSVDWIPFRIIPGVSFSYTRRMPTTTRRPISNVWWHSGIFLSPSKFVVWIRQFICFNMYTQCDMATKTAYNIMCLRFNWNISIAFYGIHHGRPIAK